MQFRILCLTLLASLFTLTACKKDSDFTVTQRACSLDFSAQPRAAVYQALLDQYATQGVTGLSAAVVSPTEGRWMGTAGYASIEDQQALQLCDLFQTASLAKSFTGIVILQLIEEDRLAFDSPVAPLLPEAVKAYIPNLDQLTVKHLLQQTSGIPDIFEISFFAELMNDPEAIYSTEELLALLEGQPALHAPGAKHHYADPNYMLLALIIDRLEGNHAESFANRIFNPLGLDEMYYHNAGFPAPAGLVASYWDQYNNGKIENISDLEIRINAYILGSGGIIASASDMLRFYEAVFDGQLLGPDMMELLRTDWVKETSESRMHTAYSHGFMVVEADDGNWMGHAGLFLGSSCYVFHNLDTGLTISVFTNTGTFSFTEKMQLIYFDLWNDLRELAR